MVDTLRNRRTFLKALGATGLSLAAPFPSRAEAGPTRPNFVVIFVDDLVYRAVGYNNPVVKTPNLDALAHDGIIFNYAYVASPICVASRASIMTGLFPQQHGSVALDATGFRQNVVERKRYRTFAQDLADAGYVTAYCGKSHLGSPLDYGFTTGAEHKAYDDQDTFAAAGEFLQAQRGKSDPFLLWVAPNQPHVPLLPAQEWLDLYRGAAIRVDPNFEEEPPDGSIYNQGRPGERYYRDSGYKRNYKDLPAGPPRSQEEMYHFIHAYYATISHLDHQIGVFIKHLKESGLYENTLIFFLADNGYHLGNHGLGNKITMHEESVRVPMFVHGSALTTRGVRANALVSTVDMYATLLDLAGIKPPDQLAGVSLKPVLEDPRAQVREYVASECVGVGGTVGQGHRMVRTLDWKYVLTDINEEALFDETVDHYEMRNVADSGMNRAVLQTLRKNMAEWMDRVGDQHKRPPDA